MKKKINKTPRKRIKQMQKHFSFLKKNGCKSFLIYIHQSLLDEFKNLQVKNREMIDLTINNKLLSQEFSHELEKNRDHIDPNWVNDVNFIRSIMCAKKNPKGKSMQDVLIFSLKKFNHWKD